MPGPFDCAIAVNFFQHIPIARHGEFLETLHRKLGSCGQVFIAINRLRHGTRARFYQKPEEPDTFDARQLADGSVYEIIDNVFTEETFRSIFEDRAINLRYHCGGNYYWVTYEVP